MRRIIYFGGNTDLDNGRRLAALFCNAVKNVTDLEKWAFYNTETGILEIQPSGKNGNALFLAENAADIIFANAKNDIEKNVPFHSANIKMPLRLLLILKFLVQLKSQVISLIKIKCGWLSKMA